MVEPDSVAMARYKATLILLEVLQKVLIVLVGAKTPRSLLLRLVSLLRSMHGIDLLFLRLNQLLSVKGHVILIIGCITVYKSSATALI